jgi:hypothetical protein
MESVLSGMYLRNFLSNRYYNEPPVGGYQVNEEHEYVLPDSDDISSSLLLEIVTQFGSPEVESFMKTIKREQIKTLPCKKIKKDDVCVDFACPICIENFKEHEQYRKLSCSHCFHKKCIDKWFKKDHTECPMCRAEIL